MKFEATEGATTTIQLIGGDVVRDPVELDSDMNAVLKITDPSKQRLKIVSTLDGHSDFVKIYRLPGLVLEAASESNSVEPNSNDNTESNTVEPDNDEPAGE